MVRDFGWKKLKQSILILREERAPKKTVNLWSKFSKSIYVFMNIYVYFLTDSFFNRIKPMLPVLQFLNKNDFTESAVLFVVLFKCILSILIGFLF